MPTCYAVALDGNASVLCCVRVGASNMCMSTHCIIKRRVLRAAVDEGLSAWMASGAPPPGYIVLDDGWQEVAGQREGHARLAGSWSSALPRVSFTASFI
jgi:hypothetical protein